MAALQAHSMHRCTCSCHSSKEAAPPAASPETCHLCPMDDHSLVQQMCSPELCLPL